VKHDLAGLLSRYGVPPGGVVEHHGCLSSTNDRMRELARSGVPEWSVVVADAQSAGRGRSGRGWASPPGNLFLSLLLRPAGEARGLGLLPLAAGVAVAEAVEPWGVASALKWPNDVLVGDRKLAGILVESASGAQGIDWAVVGIGVNVSLDPGGLEAQLRERATSVLSETGKRVSCLEVGAAVLGRLAVWYHDLSDGRVLEAWRARSVPWWGRDVELQASQGPLRGRLAGIDEAGALLLEQAGGAELRILSGEGLRLARSG
jgi:BirA family transcriptional regulator, biotin operon repressor / biotin---[acetyl-CoA-carboxylase] ligase